MHCLRRGLALFSTCQNEVGKIIMLRERNCTPLATVLYLFVLCFVNLAGRAPCRLWHSAAV